MKNEIRLYNDGIYREKQLAVIKMLNEVNLTSEMSFKFDKWCKGGWLTEDMQILWLINICAECTGHK